MVATEQHYNDAANEISNRILALIPSHPEILELTDPFKLFQVPGFQCDDISPSFAQAAWALSKAKSDYRAQNATVTP